ncbi:hypothetical protein MMC28_003834 [Mycoblastus sanguinarius]|nr:hypothetical protein [Mycoblastus sanguinarius]
MFNAGSPKHNLQQQSRFMVLPVEVRLTIYEYALATSQEITLRSPAELAVRLDIRGDQDYRSDFEICSYTNLLLVCRQILQEAVRIFYSGNKFDYSIITVKSRSIRYWGMHLQFMTNVSIDYMDHSPFLPHCESAQVDGRIATQIQFVDCSCPNLRTFTLHILNYYMRHLHESLGNNSRTSSALLAMKHRVKWLGIVTSGNELTLQGFRQIIAPREDWLLHYLSKWPGISIDEYQKSGLQKRDKDDLTHAIMLFWLCPRTGVGPREN